MTDAPALLNSLPPIEAPAIADGAPPARKSRSGTSGAERRRRAKAAETGGATPADSPPRRAAAPARKPAVRAKPLADRLASSITTLGIGVSLLNQADGMVIVSGAPELAGALSKLADENPRVRKALEGAMTASAWGGVLAATLPIAAGIAANHGALPPGVLSALGGPAGAEPAADETAPASPLSAVG